MLPQSKAIRKISVSSVDSAEISDGELERTVTTIRTLSQSLQVYRSPRLKILRSVMYPLLQEHIRREGKQAVQPDESRHLNSRISSAVEDGRVSDALGLLVVMRQKQQTIKLGAL